jgi:hypothetical protein
MVETAKGEIRGDRFKLNLGCRPLARDSPNFPPNFNYFNDFFFFRTLISLLLLSLFHLNTIF